MSLTLRTYGTPTTVSNASAVEHAERPIVFGAAFLRVEGGSLWTAQRAIGLQHKMLSSQASHTSWACPLRGTERGFSLWRLGGRGGGERRRRRFRCRLSLGKQRETHLGWLPLLAQFLPAPFHIHCERICQTS